MTDHWTPITTHGRIYTVPLKGPNPKGMSAYCDRFVFCDYGYTIRGCLSSNTIECVPLDINNQMDKITIRHQEWEKRMEGNLNLLMS
jgi:hypothetical protein